MLLNAFRSLFTNSQNRKARRASARPQLLQLEGRIVPATIPVTTTADSGPGSLRQAIIDANTTAGNDIIQFNFGPANITLGSALPTIIDAAAGVGAGTAGTVTITGSGAFTISGDNGDVNRNFNIFNIATGGNLSISGVTVSGAQVTGNGGAFNNAGTLTLLNSTISRNLASGGGGGISNFGTLTVSNSTISGNGTFGSGGGISNSVGTVTVTNSTISGNSASSGGGIFNNAGTLLNIANSIR